MKNTKSGKNRGSALVIIVANLSEMSYLCTNGLRFGGRLKVLEGFWAVGPRLVYPICCKVDNDCLRNNRERSLKYTLCVGPPKLDEHSCGVNDC